MTSASADTINPHFNWKTLTGILVLVVLASTLAGCRPGFDEYRNDRHLLISEDIEQTQPIEVTTRVVKMDIPVSAHGDGIPHHQRARLSRFLQGSREQGAGWLLIRTPLGAKHSASAVPALKDFRELDGTYDVRESSIKWSSYNNPGASHGPIRIAYRQYRAVPPDCGFWPDNLARDPENRPFAEFGCATQRNLAVSVANPRDLVEPRNETPRSSERRDVGWDKYVKGESVVSETSSQEASPISDVISGN